MLGEGTADVVDGAVGVPAPRRAPGSGFRVWRDPVTWAVAALVLGVYFTLSLWRLLRLSPGSYDLGIYTEYVKQLSQLHAPVVDMLQPGLNLLGNHFQVAVGVIAPFFRLYPSPATLLFFQALACAVSVFPVTAAGGALLSPATARLIGLAYGLSWGLQQMAFFDFHEIALAVPLLAFSLSALVRRRPGEAAGWAAPLVFVQEDQGFTVAAIGLLLVGLAVAPRGRFFGRRSALYGGAFLTVWGLSWTVLAIDVLIPHFSLEHGYYFWKDGGVVGSGAFSVGGLLSQAVDGWPVKLRTLGMTLLPTAFTALASPVALVALPILAVRFVPVNTAYWGTGFQYSATVMPVVFLAAIDAVGRWRRVRRIDEPVDFIRPLRRAAVRHAGTVMATIMVVAAFRFPLDDLWQPRTYELGEHVAAANAAMAVVPDGATVITTLDLLAPLGARTDTFWIGTAGNPLTQYIVFDGVDSGYSPPVTDVPAFIRLLYPAAGYVQVFSRDNIYVYKRG